jgi:hypothetical protein
VEGIRLEQFVLLAVVLLAALADYIARARRRHREESGQDSEVAQTTVADEYESEWIESEPLEPDFERERSRWEEIAEVLPPALPVPEQRRPVPPRPPPPLPAPPPPTSARRRRAQRRHRWLTNTRDARRGMVMMTILGPCRGLEPPAGTQDAARRP